MIFRSRGRWCAFVVAFFVTISLLSGVAALSAPSDGIVTAQEDTNGSTGPGDSWPTPGNESDGNESGNNESGGGGGGGGLADRIVGGIGAANPVPSTEDAMESAWEWMQEKFRGAMTTAVNDVFNELLGTPTPENDGVMGIAGTPVDQETAAEIDEQQEDNGSSTQVYTDLYSSVYLGYVMPLVGGFVTIMALLVLVGPALSAFTQRRMYATIGSAAVAVFLIVGSWEFATLLHVFSDEVTQFLLPDAEEVMSSSRTAYSGPIALAVGLYLTGGMTGIALLGLHGVRHMLLYLAPVVLPALILLAYWGGHRRVKQVGSFFIWQYYGLLVWNWPTAVLLRVAYELNWTFHNVGLVNVVMTMAVFFIAVILPLLVSTSFGLIGMSVRGVVAGTAGGAVSRFRSGTRSGQAAENPSRTRRVGQRLKSGAAKAGLSARNRAAGAYSRGQDRFSRNTDSDGPAPSRDKAGMTPSSRRSMADGGTRVSRNRSLNTGVTPSQRQRANHKGVGSKPKKRLERTNDGGYTVVDRR